MSAIPPVVAAAMAKAGVVWIAPAGDPHPVPAWLHWTGEAAYVVAGPGEQPLAGLAGAASATVTARSADTGGRLVSWTADVDTVEPGTGDWDEIVPTLAVGRLNSPDGADTADRWARTATVFRLSPTGHCDLLPTGSLAATPMPTPAATRTGWRRA
jgi:hypothetical protein